MLYLQHVDALLARRQLRRAELTLLPHAGKSAPRILNEMRRRAANTGAQSAAPELYAPPDVIQRDREKLRAMFGAPAPEPTDNTETPAGG